jgi:hypothetical protein
VLRVHVLEHRRLHLDQRVGVGGQERLRRELGDRAALPERDLRQVHPQQAGAAADVEQITHRHHLGERHRGRAFLPHLHRGQPAGQPQLGAHGLTQPDRCVVGHHHQGGQVAVAGAPHGGGHLAIGRDHQQHVPLGGHRVAQHAAPVDAGRADRGRRPGGDGPGPFGDRRPQRIGGRVVGRARHLEFLRCRTDSPSG